MPSCFAMPPGSPATARPPLNRIALAVALALASPHAVLAEPVGARVTAGLAQVSRPDSHTTLVHQGTDKAIINWSAFSVGAGERVQFVQPGAGSVVLNRVTGTSPSEIHGRLSANGKVFIVNPAGVMFGRDAAVDVGSLVASTLDIADGDFAAGRYTFSDSGAAGAVRNLGRLSAADAGTIALLGAQVRNDGTASARLGTVGLAAGAKVSLDFGGAGLTRIVVDAASVNALVDNGGAVLSEGGQVILSARALVTLADTVIHNSGVVRATALVERNGRIVLDGGDTGRVTVGGQLDVSGMQAGLLGGQVTMTGRDLLLADGGAIDARGAAGGGSVLVGGSYRGTDPSIRHAASTAMAPGSVIRADALERGDGGTIVLWSAGATSAGGRLSARGGSEAGAGGSIETSGRTINVAGLVADASAAHGKAGAWLLDPDELTIDTAGAATIAGVLDTGTAAVVDSSGNIAVMASIVKSDGGDATLTLNAGQDISMGESIGIASISGRLHVDFNANATGRADQEGAGIGAIRLASGAGIVSNGGNIRLYGQSDPVRGSAIGHGDLHNGIDLTNATLDTRAARGGGGGAILLRGIGGNLISEEQTGGTGVAARSSTLRSASGDILIAGTAGPGTYDDGASVGVDLDLGAFDYGGAITSTSGMISILGADGAPAGAPGHPLQGGRGVRLYLGQDTTIATGGDIVLRGDSHGGNRGALSATTLVRAVDIYLYGGAISSEGALLLTGISHGDAAIGLAIEGAYLGAASLSAGSGGLRLAGLGDASSGVYLHNTELSTRAGGQLAVAGESRGGAGLEISDSMLGDAAMRGDIVLRALSAREDARSLQVQNGVNNGGFLTSGVIALFPGGVDDSGATTAASNVPISISADSSAASGFNVALSSMQLGRADPARVVIGSREHRGAIFFDDTESFAGDLTLQNDGAGSAGIALRANVNVSGQLTLSSGGLVRSTGNAAGDAGAISASSLLLHGARPESRFRLDAPTNLVARFAATFDDAGDATPTTYGGVIFTNGSALTVGTLSGEGISGASANSAIRVPISASGTRIRGDLLIDTTGALTLEHDIATAGGDLTLVTGGNLRNPGNQALLAQGGNWRVFAPTWVGELRGNLVATRPRPNYYGCAYGSACAAEIGGNHFFYAERPRLTVTPDAIAREYGDPNPVLPFSGAQLVNGDTLADALLGGYTTTALITSPLGAYPTSGSFTSPVGYELTVQPGSMTIGPATLQVRIDDQTKVFGASEPPLSATISGFKFDDTRELVTGLDLRTVTGQAAGAGVHPITASGATAPNYRFSYRPGTLTVTRAPLAVRVADQIKTYGDPEPLLTASYAGFQYDDSAAVVSGLMLTSVTGAAATAGAHPITGAGASAANYSMVYQPGMLSVARAPLEILVDDQRKRYGDVDPALTYRVTGLRYADTPATAGGVLVSTATGAAASAGTHAIVATTGPASNYTAVTRTGTLIVDKAALLVRADDQNKTYGDPEPRLSASALGLKYADTAAVIDGLVLDAPAGVAASAGAHVISVAGGSAANYTLTYQSGILQVARAPLVVIADDARKTYGAPDPVLTATATGLKYGDTNQVLSGLGMAVPTGALATVGQHPIVALNGGAGVPNYTIDYRPGILRVDPAVLTYTANASVQFQDLPPGPLSGTVTGFAYGDTQASATVGALAFDAPGTTRAPLGAYAIQGSGLAAANYRFVQAPSNATALTVFASPAMFRPTAGRDIPFESSNVYEKNFGTPLLCAGAGPLGVGMVGADDVDRLALEWSRVRVSPNLSNCLGLGQKNGCADF